MAFHKMGQIFWASVIAILLGIGVPGLAGAEDYKVFQSQEYGFSMKYPSSWVKINQPKGNYYKVFQTAEPVGQVRARINVAAHRPVKDPISVFLDELRNAIKELQSKAKSPNKQPVKMLDEGEFKSDVPGAYYFFIQALDDKAKTWMDVVIVFFKHDDVLLRVSCLAPSDRIQDFHQIFNDVLLSVRFGGTAGAAGPREQAEQPAESQQPAPAVPAPGSSPAPEAPAPSGPAPSVAPSVQPSGPGAARPSAPAPRGPMRRPERSSTGIVE